MSQSRGVATSSVARPDPLAQRMLNDMARVFREGAPAQIIQFATSLSTLEGGDLGRRFDALIDNRKGGNPSSDGALRNLVIVLDSVVKWSDKADDGMPAVVECAKRLLDTEIDGIRFREWGTTGSHAQALLAGKEQGKLDDYAREIRHICAQSLMVAALLSGSGPQLEGPERLVC